MRHLRSASTLCFLASAFAPMGAAQCDLTTLYSGSSSTVAGGMAYLDIIVTTPVRLVAFDVNTSMSGTALDLDVYLTRSGVSHRGNEANPGAWSLASAVRSGGIAAGLDQPSTITLAQSIVLTPGIYGMALAGNFDHRMTYGNGTNQAYSNNEYFLSLGSASDQRFGGRAYTQRVWNGTMHCTSAQGLFASFRPSVSSGSSPLTVNFQDTSYTSSPNGVQSWAWDLDGDGVVDSNAANPSFTYPACGAFDVSLTVTDGQHPASSVSVGQAIEVDPHLRVQAEFTFASTGVTNQVRFTDTSSGSPTAWSWDFDGDNIPDSALRNPTWTYGTGGLYPVSLTASNACGMDTVTHAVFVLSNDECSGALPLPAGVSGPYSTNNATTSFAWPCARGGNDVWFHYRSGCSGTLQVETCNLAVYDTALEAFSGSCGSLTSVACNDDSCGLRSQLSFAIQPATDYYLRVGGYSGAQGNFSLNVTVQASGTGSFVTQFQGCGGSTLSATGSPNLGGTIDLALSPSPGAVPILWIGTTPLGTPMCAAGCILGTTFDFPLSGTRFSGTIPCWFFLRNRPIYIQGGYLGASGGCAPGMPVQLITSNTVRMTIG